MEVIGIIIGILGVLIAVFAIYFPIYYSKRINTIILKEKSTQDFNRAITLYFDRIPDEQRIPPDHLKKSLNPDISAVSKKDFRKRVKKGDNIVHLPIIAKCEGEIIGFLKAIYVKEGNFIFISYLISKSFKERESSLVTTRMIKLMKKCIDELKYIDYVVYEISIDNDGQHKSKERLFKQISRLNNLKSYYIATDYKIPEICSFDEGECEVYDANLFLTPLKSDQLEIGKQKYIELVKSIYTNIYLETYVVSEPELVDNYKVFLEMIMAETMKSTNEIINLK